MTPEQLTTIATNVLTSSTVMFFFWITYRGLKREIKSLNNTIEAQRKTLDVMERRISETEKVGEVYKNLIKELPEHLDAYKEVINKTKDEMIAELEKANQAKDEKLKSFTEIELKKLELQEQALLELPQLREDLIKTTQAIGFRFRTLSSLKQESKWVSSNKQNLLLWFITRNLESKDRDWDNVLETILPEFEIDHLKPKKFLTEDDRDSGETEEPKD